MRSPALSTMPLLLLLAPLCAGCGDDGAASDACGASLGAGQGLPQTAAALRGSFQRADDVEALFASADMPAPDGPATLTSVLVGDLDGDGRPDILYNMVAHGLPQPSWMLSQDDKGGFTSSGHTPGDLGGCLFLLDLDGDGARDLLCSAQGIASVVWGTPQGIDWTARTPLLGASGGVPITAMAAAAMDLDEDGRLDVVISRYGAPNEVYWNQGNRTFTEVASRWGLDNPGLTWSVAQFDFDGDGRADLYTMNDGIHNDTDANTALRAEGPGPDGEPRFTRIQPIAGACDGAGLFQKGQATPMGLALGDVDGDGEPEVYLAMTQNDPLLTSTGGGAWADARAALDMPEPVTSTGANMVRWSPALWDVDHDGLLDVLAGGGDDVGHGSRPGRGTSHLLFARGRSVRSFADEHTAAGLGAEGQFLSVVRADLDGDGELDLLAGGFGQRPQVYWNRIEPNGAHLLLELAGQISNPHGLGARVEVEAGSLRRGYPMGDRFGPQLGEAPILDIGLGAAKQADHVTITWPSGYVQHVGPLPAGQLHRITEPALVVITPSSRHAPADGTSEVVIEVQPQGPDGAPLADAKVEIEAPYPPATFTGPAAKSAGGVVARTLRAPSAAGSVVIEVRVDGTALAVRPRIWFD